MVFRPPTRKPSEGGYILLAVLILLALFVIAMAAAMPKVAEDIQRDRDLETMHRGKQYARAIQLYYRKFQAYPPSLDALNKTNEIRFLRKKYIDPMTGKVDWKPIGYCQNKTPMAMGFFGQPLGPPGCGPGIGTGPGGMPGMGGTPGLQGTNGQNGTGTNGIFSNSSGTGTPGTPNSGTGDQSGTGSGSTDQSGNGGTAQPGQPTDANGNPIQSGQTMGGGGIVGVSPASPKQSIYVFKKKNHYNEWEFLYSTLQDTPTMQGGNTGIGQPAGSNGQPGTGQPGIGQPGFGPNGNNGSTPINPTPSPNPQ